jgi:ribosome recycling factor
MIKETLQDAREHMDKTIEALHIDLRAIRTGRASPALVERLQVEYYGVPTPLNQLAGTTVPEPRLLVIRPWDRNTIGIIEKAILKSDIGLTPASDGKTIRLNIPQLTEERRRDLVKQVKKVSEEYRVAVRNIRRDAIDIMKKQKKDKEISEDDLFKLQDEAQRETDAYMKKIDEITASKEKEVMEV